MSSPSADRLDQISNELASILEARMKDLLAAMKGAEQTTRQIVSAEMEIARYQQVIESSGAEKAALEKETATLKGRAEEAKAAQAKAAAERDRLREELGGVEANAQAARDQHRALVEQSDALTKETTELRNKIRALEENLVRMRKMKEELLSGIGSLTQQMSQLGIGGKE